MALLILISLSDFRLEMSGVSLGVSGHRGRVVTSDQSDTDNSDLEADMRHRSSPYKDSGYRWVISPHTQ